MEKLCSTNFYCPSVILLLKLIKIVMKTKNKTEENILGHGFKLQSLVSVASPEQLAPLYCGEGLVQLLSRELITGVDEHVTPQAVHALHCVQPPSTTRKSDVVTVVTFIQ